MSKTYFDDALPTIVDITASTLTPTQFSHTFFLRDITGKFTVIIPNSVIESKRSKLTTLIEEKLGNYIDRDGFCVALSSELFMDDSDLAESSLKISVLYNNNIHNPLVVDKRLVGADWLRNPANPKSSTPTRLVFSSIKGGVGRSTALCISASHLAAQGKRVLAIDLDLEAPGLGNMLLSEDTLPEFGLLDYLVESGIDNFERDDFKKCVSPSWLSGGKGRIDVIPAIGRRSIDSPNNVLAKIARAYTAKEEAESLKTFTDRIADLVDHYSSPHMYDVILVDARAGLHETTASAIVGLGAEIFFFGIDQPQTYSGYELLLSHLGLLSHDKENDWRERIRFVEAKAISDSENNSPTNFELNMSDLMLKHIWKSNATATPIDNTTLAGHFEIDWDTSIPDEEIIQISESKTRIIQIFSDPNYFKFDPVTQKNALSSRHYKLAFSDFLDEVESTISTNESN